MCSGVRETWVQSLAVPFVSCLLNLSAPVSSFIKWSHEYVTCSVVVQNKLDNEVQPRPQPIVKGEPMSNEVINDIEERPTFVAV